MINYPEHTIAVLATSDLVVFPGATIPIVVKTSRGLAALEHAQAHDGWLLTLSSKGDEKTGLITASLSRVGSIGRIKEVRSKNNGSRVAVFEALDRFQVSELSEVGSCFQAKGALLYDRIDADESTLRSLRESLQKTGKELLRLFSQDTTVIENKLQTITDAKELSHFVARSIQLTGTEGQEVLEIVSIKNRLLKLLELLVARKEAHSVQSKINETLSESIGKKHREALLREQLKAIQDELSEGQGEEPSADDYRGKIEAAEMPVEAKEVALREANRLARMGEQSAESHVIRNYLDLLCGMPWNKTSKGEIDLLRAEQVLERDHYGLKKIKRRILEHLAVMKLRTEKRGSILLFLGPPGVGKTSLGKSIADALGREFVRVSLGGVRDDADIRGHRRTYVGALPGRIIDGIRRAKTKDPVFVLDEVDKVARGWGGDPASALLEVLDPEQNASFHDHYLDVPFDLSQVVFIATANNRDTIPGPLLDRMEVVDLSGYTTEEKFQIGRKHLVEAELKAHGLTVSNVEIGDAAFRLIIEGYTRESGVRSLRRELAKVCRAVAAEVAKGSASAVLIDEAKVIEILGPVKFEIEELNTNHEPGVVTGMAWTPVGGDVLFVEAAAIPGDGKVAVTGQLGDVMRESSQIAVALARVKLEGIAKQVLFKDKDIHLHVPSGAVPKDGPSAGVTMFTAVASMMLGISVDPRLAMTGEITLRGKVLPVGGIKEKVLAAARFGVREVILPARNAKDLEELPEETRKALTFHLVSDVDELLKKVFGDQVPGIGKRSVIPGTETTVTQPTITEMHLHYEAQ